MDEAEAMKLIEGEFLLGVTNFKKHNGGATHEYIKLKNRWIDDPVLTRLPESTQLFFLKICTTQAINGGDFVSVTTAWCQRRVGVRSSSCKRHIITLWKHGLLFLENPYNRVEKNREREVSEKKPETTPPTNQKSSRKSKHEYTAEFEALWTQYPVEFRGTKTEAYAEFRKLGAAEAAAFARSIAHVSQTYSSKDPDLPFLKHFCRFVKTEQWRDWVTGPPPRIDRRRINLKNEGVKPVADLFGESKVV